MALYRQPDGAYVISSRRMWLPGCYADERTAKYAFRLPMEALQRLQDTVNRAGGNITFEMLQAERKKAR